MDLNFTAVVLAASHGPSRTLRLCAAASATVRMECRSSHWRSTSPGRSSIRRFIHQAPSSWWEPSSTRCGCCATPASWRRFSCTATKYFERHYGISRAVLRLHPSSRFGIVWGDDTRRTFFKRLPSITLAAIRSKAESSSHSSKCGDVCAVCRDVLSAAIDRGSVIHDRMGEVAGTSMTVGLSCLGNRTPRQLAICRRIRRRLFRVRSLVHGAHHRRSGVKDKPWTRFVTCRSFPDHHPPDRMASPCPTTASTWTPNSPAPSSVDHAGWRSSPRGPNSAR